MDRLLLEKIPLAGIARLLKWSESWLQGYVNQGDEKVLRQVQVTPKPKGALTVQMDQRLLGKEGSVPQVWVSPWFLSASIKGFS
jgi:insertion element IS1 protein InsB